ncbi:MAG: hypothetical protein K5751_00100 [Treponemataceae bacterium]|nr:hypothetical protein [Treponemataceae bacterium]
MNDKNDALKSFMEIAEVIENDSSMTIQNPVLGEVIFANGTFGNLKKKNNGGFGIKHIIEGRYRKDNLSKEEISALLYLIKQTVEKVLPDEPQKTRLNLRDNGILVGISRQWMGTEESWVITGFAEKEKDNELKKEASDAIKAVNAQYGYTPEFLSIGKQVGAVIASVDKITQNKDLSSHNPLTDYTKIEVNGKERECRNGVLEGFKNAVRQLDSVIDTNHELCDENNRLVMENMRLKEQLNKKNHNKEHERG